MIKTEIEELFSFQKINFFLCLFQFSSSLYLVFNIVTFCKNETLFICSVPYNHQTRVNVRKAKLAELLVSLQLTFQSLLGIGGKYNNSDQKLSNDIQGSRRCNERKGFAYFLFHSLALFLVSFHSNTINSEQDLIKCRN